MDISITLEAQFGMNWGLWKQSVPLVEELGYSGLFRSDHIMVGKSEADSLELITSLTYVATTTQRLTFGSLVSLHDLSDGRAIFGIGAGWHDPEHVMFGFNLGDKKTRMDRLEEGVQVMHALIHRQEPVSFAGRHFSLTDANVAPRSPVKLLIGGNGPTRTLPLVARYADVWNAQQVNAAEFKEVNCRLDALIEAAGRDPKSVKRTVLVPVVCWRTEADLDRHTELFRRDAAPWRHQTHEEVKHWLVSVLGGAKGSPQQVIDAFGAYMDNGAEEVIVEWFSLADLEGIELLGEEVLPAFRPS